jgi:DNA-binding NtrC family response regulator
VDDLGTWFALFCPQRAFMEILVIDDDEIFCRLLVEIIEDWGAGTNWTTNGLAGYEMMANHAYDLCIIDVRMPLILGTDLADAMREDFPEVKVILISAFADDSLRDDASRKGIFFLSKPFTPDHLLRTIELALSNPPDLTP